MTTLEEKYEEIALDSERWSYYNKPNKCIAVTWKNQEDAFEFIVAYFQRGGKGSAFKDPILKEYTERIKKRAPHIISTYMLGIAIAESFGINTKDRNEDKVSFLYLWFMACLYHDVGYAYEKSRIDDCVSAVQKDGLSALINSCGLQYYNDFKRDIKNERIYSEEELNVYLKGRAKEHGVIDHGIVGGLLLYDKLRCNFKEAQEANGCANQNDFDVLVSGNVLHYSVKHFRCYAEAADAIITHNIWTDTLEKYKNPLTQTNAVKKQPRIMFRRNKLAFILSVADTIEPLKRHDGKLSEVSIECGTDKRGFTIYADQDVYARLYQKLPELSDWVDIDVQEFPSGQQKGATLTLPS